MKTSELLHYAFRAHDTFNLAKFYAELFEGQFFLHPVMTPLGIMMVKLNHPEAVFRGLLEFWPWDVIWDGAAAVFRRVESRPSPTSYGHLAVKVAATAEVLIAELQRRGIPHRLEPRAPGVFVPTVDDPEGNMIELFPNMDHIPVPPEALCPPERAAQAVEALRRQFVERTAHLAPEQGYSLFC